MQITTLLCQECGRTFSHKTGTETKCGPCRQGRRRCDYYNCGRAASYPHNRCKQHIGLPVEESKPARWCAVSPCGLQAMPGRELCALHIGGMLVSGPHWLRELVSAAAAPRESRP